MIFFAHLSISVQVHYNQLVHQTKYVLFHFHSPPIEMYIHVRNDLFADCLQYGRY